MMPNQSEVELDRSLAQQMPGAWHGFFDSYGRLTPVQRIAMPYVLEGRDVLICAATASGKTEAACAPLVERFQGRFHPWSILYVCPTRALANDVYYRLLGPAERLGLNIVRRSGDHKHKIKGANIIITTPESFDSLLCRGRISDIAGHELSRVRAVVLDEIHVLAGSPRGEQLRWLVERLRRLRVQSRDKGWTSHADVQVLALSATIPDRTLLSKHFLRDGVIVHMPGGRELERLGGLYVQPVIKALPAYIESSQEGLKILVFSGSRRRVDTLTTELRKSLLPLDYTVIAHHGSLSQGMREEAEESARAGSRAVFCATSTLEIGIDIGDIDLVVLDGPAPDMAAFFQRIGRGNRRTNKTCVMLCADTKQDAMIQEAMFAMAGKGWVGKFRANGVCAVARQQVASYIFQAPQQTRSREKIIDLLSVMIGNDCGNVLLDHMIDTGELNCRSSGLTLGETWVEYGMQGQIHSNIDAAYGATVVDAGTGASIAKGVRYSGGSRVDVAGHTLHVQSWDGSVLAVSRAGKSDLPAGELGYVTSGKPPVDGQAFALREHLGLEAGIWPLLQHDGKDYVFHLGGRRRLALLQYAASTGGLSIKGNEFWVTSEASLVAKPLAFSNFNVSALEIYANENLELLELRLNRPMANQYLPVALRVKEVIELLGDEEERRAVRESEWVSSADPRIMNILIAFLGSEKRRPKI